MNRIFILLMVSVLCLSGCVSRKQADDKLARGCAAGAEVFMPAGNKVKEIKQSAFNDSAELGSGYRVIRLDIVETDGWAETEKQISCIFSEKFAAFGASYTSQIYQLKMDDQVWGKQGNEIIGSMEDHMKLTEAVDNVMNKP
ncbi:MAG: hypothetical protein IT558_05290 [Alphaproteobacteria bacterium]|nr:hypothetical protein [Alphaproteobacteria bacterium]